MSATCYTSFRFQGKLIKLFSNQLVAKAGLRSTDAKHIPSLTQWLQVVGLSTNSIQGLCQRISSVEELQEKSEHELRTILTERNARPEELNRLCRALHNLRRCTGKSFWSFNITLVVNIRKVYWFVYKMSWTWKWPWTVVGVVVHCSSNMHLLMFT